MACSCNPASSENGGEKSGASTGLCFGVEAAEIVEERTAELPKGLSPGTCRCIKACEDAASVSAIVDCASASAGVCDAADDEASVSDAAVEEEIASKRGHE